MGNFVKPADSSVMGIIVRKVVILVVDLRVKVVIVTNSVIFVVD